MDLSSVIASWQTKLLQLDRRNSLLYFRGGGSGGGGSGGGGTSGGGSSGGGSSGGGRKRNAVTITGTDVNALFERLQRTRSGLAFPYAERRRPSKGQILSADQPDEETEVVVPGDLETNEPPLPLQRILSGLHRKDREWEEEQGINVLFVAFGFLNWIDDAGESGFAPLLLAPADLKRDSPRDPWRLHLEDDDLQINATLRHKLHTLGIDLPGVEQESPSSYLERIRVAISTKQDWTVTPEMALSTFPFGKMAMWEDLESMRVDGFDHPLVAALAGEIEALRPADADDSNGLPPSEELAGGGLDDLLPVRDQFAVLPADHSQLRAIELVRRGSHVVIHGPPGTGKSQTIANIIATLLSDGKRILFVSEKTAALDVVKRRLEECELGVFCLDLHSDRARKSSVYAQLGQALGTTKTKAAPFPHNRLQQQREQLNSVSRALHEVRDPLGLSVFQVHGRYARVRDLVRVDFPVTDIEELTDEALDRILQTTARVARRKEEFKTLHTSPWRALRQATWTVELPDDLRQLSDETRQAYSECRQVLTSVAASLGVQPPETPADSGSMKDLARHLSVAPGVPRQWLEQGPLRRLRERAGHLQQTQSDRRELSVKLEPVFGGDLPDLPFPDSIPLHIFFQLERIGFQPVKTVLVCFLRHPDRSRMSLGRNPRCGLDDRGFPGGNRLQGRGRRRATVKNAACRPLLSLRDASVGCYRMRIRWRTSSRCAQMQMRVPMRWRCLAA